jgi:hypothetical protein
MPPEDQSYLLELIEIARKLGMTSMVWSTDREFKTPKVTVAAWPLMVSAETEMDALVRLVKMINQAK